MKNFGYFLFTVLSIGLFSCDESSIAHNVDAMDSKIVKNYSDVNESIRVNDYSANAQMDAPGSSYSGIDSLLEEFFELYASLELNWQEVAEYNDPDSIQIAFGFSELEMADWIGILEELALFVEDVGEEAASDYIVDYYFFDFLNVTDEDLDERAGCTDDYNVAVSVGTLSFAGGVGAAFITGNIGIGVIAGGAYYATLNSAHDAWCNCIYTNYGYSSHLC